jgi:predicted amidohydrolase YtcJ
MQPETQLCDALGAMLAPGFVEALNAMVGPGEQISSNMFSN